MPRPIRAAALLTVLVMLSACGGGTPLAPVDAAEYTLRAVSIDGGPLGPDAVSITATTADETCLELRATGENVLGVELSYDPALQHVLRVERGGYFGDEALYLAVTSVPGRVAIGGYPFDSSSQDEVIARVIMAAGPAPRAASAALPVHDGCTARAFGYTDNGDGTATLSWEYASTGDLNQDGLVFLTDITPVGQYFERDHSQPGWEQARLADANEDDYVTVADLTPIGQFYDTQISGYKIEQSGAATGPYGEVAAVPLADGETLPWLSFSHTLAAPADGAWYRVRAYSEDDETQGAATAPLQLSLLPPGDNPVAVAAANVLSGQAPLTVSLSGGGSYDLDGTITEWWWDLEGDLVYELDATAELGAATHVYEQPGTYYPRLKVIDDDGRQGTDALTITVAGASEPPEVYAWCTPCQGWTPLTVCFSPFGSADPDGQLTAWEWDLDGDGSFETDATAAEGYAEHTYTAAGQYDVSLRLTDDTGVSAVRAVSVSVRDPALSTVDYWSVFDPGQVRRVDLAVSQQNWDLMWVDVNAEVEVQADAVVFGTSLPSIGLRMKGNSSLSNPSEKKPWKIDTNEYSEEQEYENLKMLIFNNGFKDPSLAREVLAYRMLAFAGVPASNTCMVEIWISIEQAPPEFWGVYTMVERVDEKYLFNRFGNKGGNLYKGTHEADLSYLGDDIAAYPLYDGEPCYAKKTNEDEADYSDILELLRVLNTAPDATFAYDIEALLNVDGYLRYLAATLLHSNLDVHMYMNQNFYLYHDETTGRFEWIPWDLNESWGQFGDRTANESHALYELMGGVGGPGVPHNVLFERVLAEPAYRLALAAYYDLLLRYHFDPDAIAAEARALHDLVESYVKQGDKMYTGPGAMYDYTDFDVNWDQDVSGNPGPSAFAFGIGPFTQTRHDYALAHLLSDL